MAFGVLFLAFALAGDRIYQSGQSRVTPYVVEVHDDEVKAVGPAERSFQPTDAEIARDLSRFITDVRSAPLDPVLVRKNLLEANDYATDKAALFLTAYAQANRQALGLGRHRQHRQSLRYLVPDSLDRAGLHRGCPNATRALDRHSRHRDLATAHRSRAPPQPARPLRHGHELVARTRSQFPPLKGNVMRPAMLVFTLSVISLVA